MVTIRCNGVVITYKMGHKRGVGVIKHLQKRNK